MESLSQQRCQNHAHREAVACCPECARFFCRECITEHDDRVICASCLKKLAGQAASKARRFQGLETICLGLLSFLFLWIVFYSIGRGLLSIPSSFHDGTLWKELAMPES